MIYEGKEYKKVTVGPLAPWGNTCSGCAFENDNTGCLNSHRDEDPETHCMVETENFIFQPVIASQKCDTTNLKLVEEDEKWLS